MIRYVKLTRCMLWNLLHLDLFYSSTLDLFNTQANADAVPVGVCPSSPKVHQSEGSLVRRFTSTKVHLSEINQGSLVQNSPRFISPKLTKVH